MKGLFLSSRKLARDNRGFSLVELIVVIAIMAILAGVGVAGYGKYIEYANKNADKTLVGNVIRAIETGTNSTMFVNDDSIALGATTYPVGIITLTQDSCQVNVSTAEQKTEASDVACDMESITVVTSYTTTPYHNDMGLIEKIASKLGITPKEDLIEYAITTNSVQYCTTHTKLPAAKTIDTKVEQVPAKWGPIPLGNYYDATASGSYLFAEDCIGLYKLVSDHVEGEFVESTNLSSYGMTVSASDGNPLYDSISAAFGNTGSLKLKYDGWGDVEDEGHTYATFLAYSNSLMGNIKSTADTLIQYKSVADALGYLSKDYTDSADMMDSFSNHLLTQHPTESSWMSAWNGAADGNIDYNFGMPDKKYHHDYVYAATKSYNSSFASYCKANGVSDTYTSAIENYTTPPNETGYDLLDIIPRTVNYAAFAGNTSVNSSKTLKDQFLNASDKDTDEAATAAFETCEKLYTKYLNSSVCEKNGKVFYDTMKTVSETGSEAYASGLGENDSDSYFKYYENYLNEMAAFYQSIQENEGKGIIIVVTVENGIVTCDVSPSSANPRND